MQKKHSLTHTSKTFKNQIAIYKKRLKTVNLIWCNQVIDFIQNSKIKSIKDIGCNYFQFYKELKLRKIKTKYFGYDKAEGGRRGVTVTGVQTYDLPFSTKRVFSNGPAK